MPLAARPVFTLHVHLADPIDVGPVPTGHRRIIPIGGGTVDGPELSGTILPGGADWNLTGTDGTARMWARYDFRTDNGAVVGVTNEGTHWFGASTEPTTVDPPSIAIITRPVFEASVGAPSWLNTGTFAGLLRVIGPLQVDIEVFRLVIQP
ncbi:MAG: DUF3237 domain-containing protein [Trebonia sp.]